MILAALSDKAYKRPLPDLEFISLVTLCEQLEKG